MDSNKDPCYFCSDTEVVPFKEHYYFCTNCTAIWTHSLVLQADCKHINEDSVEAIREPWFANNRREKPYIVKEQGEQMCCICEMPCLADGW